LHAGIIHFIFNMLAQVTAAAQVRFDFSIVAFSIASSPWLQIEREMGSVGFIITYMAAGIFG
jgi:membrane associated rhomboid family serine protease